MAKLSSSYGDLGGAVSSAKAIHFHHCGHEDGGNELRVAFPTAVPRVSSCLWYVVTAELLLPRSSSSPVFRTAADSIFAYQYNHCMSLPLHTFATAHLPARGRHMERLTGFADS